MAPAPPMTSVRPLSSAEIFVIFPRSSIWDSRYFGLMLDRQSAKLTKPVNMIQPNIHLKMTATREMEERQVMVVRQDDLGQLA